MVQVLGEVALLQSKVARLVTKAESEWGHLSHIIQQDRQARVKRFRLEAPLTTTTMSLVPFAKDSQL